MGPRISIIVPTFQEAENLPSLIAAIRDLGLDAELLIMDDDSRDGTAELIADLDLPWVHLHVRTTDRGLSPAVLDGLRRARGEVLVVMDADGSHPPESIPALLAALDRGHDFVIGSRYCPGGRTDDEWGLLRRLNSKVATWLARPFSRAHDPMSGFFALRRSTFVAAATLNPLGYKIGLELLVKCRCRNVAEVPIHFQQRRLGHSKLSLAEQWRYLQHLQRLAAWRAASDRRAA